MSFRSATLLFFLLSLESHFWFVLYFFFLRQRFVVGETRIGFAMVFSGSKQLSSPAP